jgi:hypothetical protein
MSEIKWPEFRQNKEFTSGDALLSIAVSPNDPIPVGAHTFQLVVVDNSGNASRPAQIQILVRDSTAPTAVINAADLDGRPLRDNTVESGAGFVLNGKGSVDLPPGKIEKYIWTLVAP